MASDNLTSDWYKDFNELISNSILKVGDLVEICNGFFWLNRKWVVYVGDGKAIHYSGCASSSGSSSSSNSLVREDKMLVLTNFNNKWARKNNETKTSSVNDPSMIAERAHSKVHIYLPKEIFEGNHHFALWCRNGTGKAKVTNWCDADDLFPQLEVGDLIEIKSSNLYRHWTVYIGDKWCVHLTFEVHDMKNGWVNKDRYESVINEKDCRINNSMDTKVKPFTGSEIVERALSKLDAVGYSMISKNCEHLVRWCRYDIEESLQVPKIFRTQVQGKDFAVNKQEKAEEAFDLQIKD